MSLKDAALAKTCTSCRHGAAGPFACTSCDGPASPNSQWKPIFDRFPQRPKDPSATGFLAEAAETLDARGRQYDQKGGERSMGKVISMFNTATGRDLRESEGWLIMELVKIVRDSATPNKAHEDSLLDCISYAALKAEARMAGR